MITYNALYYSKGFRLNKTTDHHLLNQLSFDGDNFFF